MAEYDKHAVPKVIDFGMAKPTAQKLTECTVFTAFWGRLALRRLSVKRAWIVSSGE